MWLDEELGNANASLHGPSKRHLELAATVQEPQQQADTHTVF